MERIHEGAAVYGGWAEEAGLLKDGSLPELPVGINFGGERRDAKAFAASKQCRPDGPFMRANTGRVGSIIGAVSMRNTHAKKAGDEHGVDASQGYSVSIYMFHGGTSFGWMNGANSDGKEAMSRM